MGFMAPKVETKAVTSQSTPLANNVLKMLQDQIRNGTNNGFNSLQRDAGTAIQQFVNSGGKPFNFVEGFEVNPFEGLGLDFDAIPENPALSTVRDAAKPGAIRDTGGTNLDFRNVISGQTQSNIRDTTALPGVRDVSGVPQVKEVGLEGSGPFTLSSDFQGTGPFTGTGFSNINTAAPAVRDVGMGDVKVRDVGSSIAPVRDVNLNLDPGKFDLQSMIDNLTTMSNQQVDTQAKDLREQHGIAGTRFGSSLAAGESNLRAKAAPALAATIGDIIMKQDAANQNRAALDLQAQQAGVGRDLGINEAQLGKDTLGVNRDIGTSGVTTDRLGLGVQRDLGVGQQGIDLQGLNLEKEKAASNENVALRGLASEELLGLTGLKSQESTALRGLQSQELMTLLGLNQDTQKANAANALGVQELGVNRDLGVAGQNLDLQSLGVNRDLGIEQALAQILGIGVQRDTAANQGILDLLGLGINRDVAAGGQALDASGQAITRDLGVQGNELAAAGQNLDRAKLASSLKEAMARFSLDKTQAGQADSLARTQTQADVQQGQQQQLLAAIQMMSQMGNDAFAPILQAMLAGINPADTVVKDSGWKAGADAVGGILQGIGSIVGKG